MGEQEVVQTLLKPFIKVSEQVRKPFISAYGEAIMDENVMVFITTPVLPPTLLIFHQKLCFPMTFFCEIEGSFA